MNGGYENLVLGRNFANYLQNINREDGHGHYGDRYSEIPPEERKLFETIVFLMLQNRDIVN